jgi:hypothetical protein
VSDIFQDSSAGPVFQTVVTGSRNRLLFNVSSSDISSSNAFDSLSTAEQNMVIISQRLWAQEVLSNPGFANFAPSATTGLLNAIKAYFGRGILISIVLKNGDVATFEINPMDPNAARYVKGSAKDRDGNSLPDLSNPIGSGGSGSVGVTTATGGSRPATSYSVGNYYWLVCSYVGSILQGCYVTVVQP